jgi:hypothetical protein
MSPVAAAAAFSAGVLIVLGLAYVRRQQPSQPSQPGQPAPPVAPGALRFRLTDVDSAPADLAAQVPCEGVLLRRIPGPDRPDYWLARLDAPVRWSQAGTVRTIDHLVLASRLVGESIEGTSSRLDVGVALVLDPTLSTDERIDFAKIAYVAIGVLERV